MIVVADTSPLNYLLQIGCESVLPTLYKRIVVPSAVLAEFSHPDTPSIVSGWLLRLPEWIEVRRTASPPDASLASLDPGERCPPPARIPPRVATPCCSSLSSSPLPPRGGC